MGVRMRGAVCVGAAGAFLLVPVAAQAKTQTVHMGEPASTVKKFENKYGTDVNNFFPHGITIHVGDKLKFVPDGFHTVDIPARGGGPAALITPNGSAVTGVTDAAGTPFWFNGQPNVAFNPILLKNRFGKRATYRGTKAVLSGLPLSNKPKPFTVKFAKTGTYTYFCNIHTGMKGVVRVVGRRHKAQTARQIKRIVRRQVKSDLNTAKKLAKTTPPSGTVDVGVHGPGGVEFYGMVPGSFSVKLGTTIRFRMSPGSTEDHTATFGPGNPMTQPTSYLGQIAKSFQGIGPFDPRAVYPSEPPPTVGTLTQTSHGNGFWNSGVMDTSSASPLPESASVKFGQVGTYNYYCMIHPFMHGVITVTP
jgi:plastocyanin